MKYTNCSIKVILDKWDSGIRTFEIQGLYSAIQLYKENIDDRIAESINAANLSQTDNKLKWVQENVPSDISHYVCCELLGKEYDVLMRSANKYKTIAEIGIEVIDESDSEANLQQYLEAWNAQAKRLSKLNVPAFESHAHYNLGQYKPIRAELMELMHQSGIDQIIIPAIDYSTNAQMIELFDKPEYSYVHLAFGSHPKYIWSEEWTNDRWDEYKRLLTNSKCVAVGEAGLDYSYAGFNEDHRIKQMKMSGAFIEAANEFDLPVILHIRPADNPNECAYDVNDDALNVLNKTRILNGAVFHCFNGSETDVDRYMAAGVNAFGIGGKITYGNPQLEAAVKKMPEDAILLETDAPYIKLDNSKMPNTSLSLIDIAYKVAEVRNVSVEHILKVTYENAKRVFGKV